jgi:hypothetical protein
MKTVEEFIKSMVKIDFIEDSDCFGHYPFQLLSENKDGKIEINSLALGGDVASCYIKFSDYKKQGSKRIYLSLDFPKTGDIKNDFIAIFSFENEEINLLAIPYETENGNKLDYIRNSNTLSNVKEDLLSFLN